ncbi:hypothetical protein STXM2123_4885 [Streptomyces sp. F-3]|nr:hypothetical protein STXM2123_4885 [Streptomyces sp. F-3]
MGLPPVAAGRRDAAIRHPGRPSHRCRTAVGGCPVPLRRAHHRVTPHRRQAAHVRCPKNRFSGGCPACADLCCPGVGCGSCGRFHPHVPSNRTRKGARRFPARKKPVNRRVRPSRRGTPATTGFLAVSSRNG